MASSKPPTKAIRPLSHSPRDGSGDDLLSPASPSAQKDALKASLGLIELMALSGLVMAPAAPEAKLVEAAAQKVGIEPKQALEAFLIIAGFGELEIH
ncbi:MAG: hypothetical protein KAI73_01620 [Rhodospirillaceae bacterium]|nr:hypothetical protein [Rhodospirillaceae bacterium]